MKTIAALAASALALAVGAAQAPAASDPDRRIAALERQVAALTRAQAAPHAPAATPADRKIAALEKKVAALEKKVTTLTKGVTEATRGVEVAIVYGACLTAVTSDALAGTWNVIDQIAAATQAGKVYFGPQTAVNDAQTCTALRITRQATVPPSVASFSALTALLGR